MAVKVTGSEWRDFYADPQFWPKGAWHDDEQVLVDGQEPGDDFNFDEVDSAAILTVAGGIVFMRENAQDGPSLEAHFRRWRKQQTTAVLIVEVPHASADAVRAAIAAAGGKVRA